MMVYIYFTIAAAAVLCLNTSSAGEPVASSGELENANREYLRISAYIKAISKSKNVDEVERAGQDITAFLSAFTNSTQETKPLRRMKLELFFSLLSSLDEHRDKQFDSKDTPQINVAPPPGVVLNSGLSPTNILDRELRRRYEKAIAENKMKAQHYRFQMKLRAVDKKWFDRTIAYVRQAYAVAPLDVGEIKACIDEYLTDAARKEQVRIEFERIGYFQPIGKQPKEGGGE